MESEREQILAQLRESERGEVAAWLSWEPRRWYGAFFAAWTFAFVANGGLADDGFIGSSQAYLVLTFVALSHLWWQRREVGAYPTGSQPPELRWPVVVAMTVFGAVVLVSWALVVVVPWWVAALGGAVATYAVMEAYRLAYHRAAERVRARLSSGQEVAR
ncbi:hypothetical protein [Nocardioides marmoraquaticus]